MTANCSNLPGVLASLSMTIDEFAENLFGSAEREIFGPANLSMLATRFSDKVGKVFAFLLP